MNENDPKFYERKPAQARKGVAWNPPAERQQQIYTYDVTCEHCGRFFRHESMMPIAPKYCLQGDEKGCYLDRKAAYKRAYRAKQKDETQEG